MPASRPTSNAQAELSWLSYLNHLQPVLLLSMLQVSFKHMVADPTTTLTSMIVPLVLLQTIHLSFGQTSILRSMVRKKTNKGGPAKKGDASPSIVGTKILVRHLRINRICLDNEQPMFLALLLTFVTGTPTIYIAMVLFGAPLTTHTALTVLCALHVALLAALPLIYVHQVDDKRWREIISLQLHVDEVYGASLGTLLGAWLGAIPIPLDWDREWQKWPLTIVAGAYLGYILGKSLGMVFEGKKLPF